MYPSDRRYSKDFAWIQIEGSQGTVGLTDHAVKLLSPIESVILHAPGRTLKPGGGFGSVEGTKAVSDLLTPMSGVVTDVNVALHQNPKPLQDDPHGTWLIKLTLSDPSKASTLLSSTDFEALVNPPPKPPRKKPKKTRPATPPAPPVPPAPPPTPQPVAIEPEKLIKMYWGGELSDCRLHGGDDAFGDRDNSGGGHFSWRERDITFVSEPNSSGGLDRSYHWRDTRHLRVSAGGMSNTTTSHSDYTGTWSIDVVGETPHLVMEDSERGRLRFALEKESGGGVLLEGRPYTRRRIR